MIGGVKYHLRLSENQCCLTRRIHVCQLSCLPFSLLWWAFCLKGVWKVKYLSLQWCFAVPFCDLPPVTVTLSVLAWKLPAPWDALPALLCPLGLHRAPQISLASCGKSEGCRSRGRRWKEGEGEKKRKVVRRTSRSRRNFKSSPSPGY